MTIDQAIRHIAATDPRPYERLITKVVELTGLSRVEVAKWFRAVRKGEIKFDPKTNEPH